MNTTGMTTALYRSVPEASRDTGISKDYLYYLIKTGKAEHIRIGKKFLLHYPNLLEYLETEAKKGISTT